MMAVSGLPVLYGGIKKSGISLYAVRSVVFYGTSNIIQKINRVRPMDISPFHRVFIVYSIAFALSLLGCSSADLMDRLICRANRIVTVQVLYNNSSL